MADWIEACAADDVEEEDVIRFDHGGRTFAIYRSPDDEYFATDGLCTHEQVHLADGLVMDDIIECPKHNGRFNYKTGQARGAPVCVNLRTYPVKVEGRQGADPDADRLSSRIAAYARAFRATADRKGIGRLDEPTKTEPQPTVADLRAMKGKRQLTMLRVMTLDEAEAAETRRRRHRLGAARADARPALPRRRAQPLRDARRQFLRDRHHRRFRALGIPPLQGGADAVYCSAGFATVKRLADDAIPVIGHVGLIPSRATWTGGFKAVGKTAESAMQIMRGGQASTRPPARSAPRSRWCRSRSPRRSRDRTSLIMLSMGAGTGCDAQYLFAEDILGQNRGHMPRHSKVYRNFAAEYDRLQAERVAAFSEYVADVESGAYPEDRHVVHMDPAELRRFLDALDSTA